MHSQLPTVYAAQVRAVLYLAADRLSAAVAGDRLVGGPDDWSWMSQRGRRCWPVSGCVAQHVASLWPPVGLASPIASPASPNPPVRQRGQPLPREDKLFSIVGPGNDRWAGSGFGQEPAIEESWGGDLQFRSSRSAQ